MRALRPITVVVTALLVACSPSVPELQSAVGASNASWKQHCTLDGISDRTFFKKLAQECAPVDACILACVRAGCATEVKGGCFHSCSSEISGASDGRAANAFRDGNDPTCKVRG